MTVVKNCPVVLLATTVSFSANALNNASMPKATVHTFRDAINAHDLSRIAALLTDDNVFIDANGSEVIRKVNLTAGWDGFFKLFPDYHIEISDVFAGGTAAGDL